MVEDLTQARLDSEEDSEGDPSVILSVNREKYELKEPSFTVADLPEQGSDISVEFSCLYCGERNKTTIESEFPELITGSCRHCDRRSFLAQFSDNDSSTIHDLASQLVEHPERREAYLKGQDETFKRFFSLFGLLGLTILPRAIGYGASVWAFYTLYLTGPVSVHYSLTISLLIIALTYFGLNPLVDDYIKPYVYTAILGLKPTTNSLMLSAYYEEVGTSSFLERWEENE